MCAGRSESKITSPVRTALSTSEPVRESKVSAFIPDRSSPIRNKDSAMASTIVTISVLAGTVKDDLTAKDTLIRSVTMKLNDLTSGFMHGEINTDLIDIEELDIFQKNLDSLLSKIKPTSAEVVTDNSKRYKS